MVSSSLDHEMICKKLKEIYIDKHADYGNSFGESFIEWGLISAAVRMDDKMRRLKQLAKGNTARVKTESIRDTLMDLANYAIMTVMELDKRELERMTSVAENPLVKE